MTGFAIDRGMGSQQGKPVHVLVDRLHGNLPAPHGMAVFATGTELAPVDVSVALCTFGPYILED